MADTTRWARAAITVAAVSCYGVTTAATAAADPPDYDLRHHPAPALAPGVGIGIYDGNGCLGFSCGVWPAPHRACCAQYASR